jgi:NAD(P)-dependent dehydrogenase (short-subunit alcohol dehydrogenase family)
VKALVTGAASGIGRAIAERLASDGYDVVAADIAPVEGGVRLDVSDPEDWQRAAAGLDRLDVACLNAGIVTGTGDLAELSDEQYRRILGVNVDGVVFGVRALLPLLERDGGGRIVVTASLAGLTTMESDPIYSATKHFLVGFVRSVAPQLAERGVTIDAVCPGIADTAILGEARAVLEEAGFPLLRPEEVAEAVVAALADPSTGQAWVCQLGREPEPYRFHGVPGPRLPGVEGVRPPI